MAKFDDSPKIVLADLVSLFNEIESDTNQKQFFLKTASYGKYIQENKFTIDILRNLYQEAREDADVYLSLWNKFVKIWKQYATDLLKMAEKVGLKDNPSDPFSNEIGVITSRLAETDTSVWETDLDYFYSPYRTLITKFKNINKDDLLIPEHIEEKDGLLTIYPFYVEALGEWEKFKNTRETKVWWAHYQICRLAVGVLDMKEKEKYFTTDDVVDDFYRYEFREVSKGNINHSPIVLHKHKYDACIKRLHNYLIPRLQNLIDDTSKTIPLSKEAQRTNKQLRLKINNILKTGKFGKKEKAFIRFLAKDFKPKYVKAIQDEIGSGAIKQLKATIKRKLKNTEFSLETIRAYKWGGQTQYQLQYLTRK